MIDPAWHDAIRERVMTASMAERMPALAMLAEIVRWCEDGSECRKTARELAALLRMNGSTASNLLELLEVVGAIRSQRCGIAKVIRLIPLGDPPLPSGTVTRDGGKASAHE